MTRDIAIARTSQSMHALDVNLIFVEYYNTLIFVSADFIQFVFAYETLSFASDEQLNWQFNCISIECQLESLNVFAIAD